jgi:signal transduction histidine kinase/ActR/RegA family two-component response regulator
MSRGEPSPPSAASPELYATILSLCPAAIAVFEGAENHHVLVNAAYRALSRAQGPLLGRSLREVWPEAVPSIGALLDRVRKTGVEEFGSERPFQIAGDKGADTLWLTFSVVPLRGDGGQVERVLVMASDMSQQVRALHSAHEMAAHLEISNALTMALSGAQTRDDVARVAFEKGLRVLGVNAGVLGILGAAGTPNALPPIDVLNHFGSVGPAVEGWQALPPDLRCPLADAARLGKEIWLESLEEAQVRYPEWSSRWSGGSGWSWIALPLRARGKPLGALGLAFRSHLRLDLWFQRLLHSVGELCAQALDRVRALEEAQQRAAELAEADRRKTEFIHVLSHELRNPLAAIRNGLQLIERVAPSGGLSGRAEAVLRRQTEHLARMVDDLLDVSRIGRGKVELRLARLDAREVVRSACDDLRPAFEKKGVRFRHQDAAEPIWVEADATRLAQMVGNLVGNALKFTPPGGEVVVEVARREGWCRVTVRDTGAGIVAADLERIFEPFEQGEAARSRGAGGLGIGLSLVRDLAALHGGSARARSEGLGRGAELELDLPSCPEAASRAAGNEAPSEVSGLSIVVVEDNEDAGSTLAELLTMMGNRVRVEASGRSGIDAVLADRPDVLVCDIGLPDLSGYEVIRRLRAAMPADGPFAIALTGYAQPRDQEEAFAAGFDGHLAKPPSFEALATMLAAAPGGGRLRTS